MFQTKSLKKKKNAHFWWWFLFEISHLFSNRSGGGFNNQPIGESGINLLQPRPRGPTKIWDRPSTGRAPDIHSSAELIFPTLQAPFEVGRCCFFQTILQVSCISLFKKNIWPVEKSTKRCVYTIYYMSIFMYSIFMHVAFMKKQVAGNYIMFFWTVHRIDKQNLQKKTTRNTSSTGSPFQKSGLTESIPLFCDIVLLLRTKEWPGDLCLTPSHQIPVIAC